MSDSPAKVGENFNAYANIVERIWSEIQKKDNLAPIILAGMRELRNFPHYADATILLLHQISIDGDTPFDRLLIKEMADLEDSLLGMSRD